VAGFRAASPEQAAYLRELLEHGLLLETGVPGVYGQAADFERVREAFTAAVMRAAVPDRAEPMRFPPLLPRYQIETNGYLASFPHLAGSVFSFAGSDAQAAEQEAIAGRHEDWSGFQSMTDLVVLPAACYPVYPEVAKRGPLPAGGVTIDTGSSWVYRNEPSDDPARMQIFHMLEFVRIGDPNEVGAFRDDWLDRTLGLFGRVGLEATSELASDPFFGRAGRMLAANQRVQELKFALVVMIGGPEPTAIASFNYHQDHFTLIYGIAMQGGGVAHTGCVAFGLERITLALFRRHGLELAAWPDEVRTELWP
jgi:seryl-tRNA synthetase